MNRPHRTGYFSALVAARRRAQRAIRAMSLHARIRGVLLSPRHLRNRVGFSWSLTKTWIRHGHLYIANQTLRSAAARPGLTLAALSIVLSILIGMLSLCPVVSKNSTTDQGAAPDQKVVAGQGSTPEQDAVSDQKAASDQDAEVNHDWSNLFFFFKAMPVFFIVIAMTSFVAAFLTWWRFLGPEMMAEIYVNGRDVKEIMAVVPLYIYSIVARGNQLAQPVRRFAEALRVELGASTFDTRSYVEQRSVLRDVWQKHRYEVMTARRRLARFHRKQHALIERTEALVIRAAASLGIPAERFCGQLLHFSPTLFAERTKELISAIDETVQDIEIEWPESKEIKRFDREQVQTMWGVIEEGRKRQAHQEMLLRHSRYHEALINVVSARSASAAVREYAECLAALDEATMGDLEAALIYLRKGQRAYSGIAPHLLLTNLLKDLLASLDERDIASEEKLRRQLELLDTQNQLRKALYLQQCVDALSSLRRYVADYNDRSGGELANRFERLFNDWTNGIDGRCYIVTQGGSNTVKSVLGRALKESPAKNPWFVCFPIEEERFFLSSRRIMHGLKRKLSSRFRQHTAILKPDSLLNLLEPGDGVMLLLGTEFIDGHWRFVHPKGLSSLIRENLKEKCQEKAVAFQSVIVAERYKKQDIDLADLKVNGDHIDDHFELYCLQDKHVDQLICPGHEESFQAASSRFGPGSRS